ncbi:SDR family NAD(P)-dependent oxidoreductase [Ovoidimarina sediminis]|uniref:SDR family NAD(P)-dependent oxidoreductase n=1 Tax=Ovoidimarina sediminis TaxID=3079856 RepID=UPI0029101177|nr:SDR family oxidoreductase [Rhodophyticola sp. MJ-SS7]MDU8944231.1 SDR family oxidoreductase [Rhodophyticola sp. MJ-SS7]
MRPLSDKTVVVTGASKGIGAAIASALIENGARIVSHYGGDREGAEAAVEGAAPGQATLLSADFHDMAAVDRFWAEASDALGGAVDVLINNAGMMRQSGGIPDPIEEWDAVWQETMTVNVYAPARLLRHAVNAWLDAGRAGSVIGIGSWAATRGTANPRAIAYAASKAAITAATKTVARNHAHQGILAYVIAPGVVRTQMSVDSAAIVGGEEAVTATLPMGEWVPPSDIGEICVFLAEGRARHLSGATIDVNGAAYIR